MIRSLLLVVSLLVINSVQANDVICKKDGRFWKPSNDKAKMIAESLGVKTCNGKRFKEVLVKAGLKSNVKATKKRLSVDELAAKLKK